MRPVTQSFDFFFDLRLNKRLSKQSWGWWFETPPCPLWRQCNGMACTDFTMGICYLIPIPGPGGKMAIRCWSKHCSDVTKSAMASRTTGVSIVYSTVCSGVDRRKHQSSASLAFVRGIHWWPVNSPHKRPVTQKMLPFDDVIMKYLSTIMIYLSAITHGTLGQHHVTPKIFHYGQIWVAPFYEKLA